MPGIGAKIIYKIAFKVMAKPPKSGATVDKLPNKFPVCPSGLGPELSYFDQAAIDFLAKVMRDKCVSRSRFITTIQKILIYFFFFLEPFERFQQLYNPAINRCFRRKSLVTHGVINDGFTDEMDG